MFPEPTLNVVENSVDEVRFKARRASNYALLDPATAFEAVEAEARRLT